MTGCRRNAALQQRENSLPHDYVALIRLSRPVITPGMGPRVVKTVAKNEAKSKVGWNQNRLASHLNRSSGPSSCHAIHGMAVFFACIISEKDSLPHPAGPPCRPRSSTRLRQLQLKSLTMLTRCSAWQAKSPLGQARAGLCRGGGGQGSGRGYPNRPRVADRYAGKGAGTSQALLVLGHSVRFS